MSHVRLNGRVSNYVSAGDIGSNPEYLNELRDMETEDVEMACYVYPPVVQPPQPAAKAAAGRAFMERYLHGCVSCEEDAVDASELFV